MKPLSFALIIMLALTQPGLGQSRVGAWTRLDMDGKRPATMTVAQGGVITIEANNAVSFFYRPLLASEMTQDLSWRWRVDATPPATALNVTEQDDRPLAVHVVFSAPANSNFFDRLSRGIKGMVAGPLFQGRMITYVFGGAHAAGTRLPNPYLPNDAAIIVLRDGRTPVAQWFEERVNPGADYARVFGEAAPRPTLLSISSDTDDRGGKAQASIEFEN